MPKYRYQAVDAAGDPVSGEVEATGLEEARRRLAAEGIDAERAQLTEVRESSGKGGRFSNEEAAEFGSQLAQLAKAGLPLAPGLRALAEEIRPRLDDPEFLLFLGRSFLTFGLAAVIGLPSLLRRIRMGRVLRQLADQLDAGLSLEAALESLGKRFPTHVRGLILAGVGSGRLAEALEEFAALENGRVQLQRRVRYTLAYPCTLFGLVVALVMLACLLIVPQFIRVFSEFGAELPAATKVLAWMAGPGLGVVIGVPAVFVAGLVLLGLARRSVWSRRVLYAVPLLGPMWRWAGLFNFARLMTLLLGQQIPLPKALRLTAAGLREADLSAACLGAAERVEAGRSLSEVLADFWQFPPSLRPLVAWGEETSSPAAAFRAGAEMFEGRVGVSVTLLQAVLPPIVFVSILGAVGFVVIALFSPLISLITTLSG
ncbi:MAG: type II secretion system F family protein [Planctomycetota bacterium]